MSWNLLRTIAPPKPEPGTTAPASSGIMGGLVAGVRRGLNSGPRLGPASPGSYRVVLAVDGKEQSDVLKLESDPAYPETSGVAEEASDIEETMEREEIGKRID